MVVGTEWELAAGKTSAFAAKHSGYITSLNDSL